MLWENEAGQTYQDVSRRQREAKSETEGRKKSDRIPCTSKRAPYFISHFDTRLGIKGRCSTLWTHEK